MLVPLHRRNYILGIVNGILVEVGNRLGDAQTVLPLLLLHLTGMTWTVGMVQAIILLVPAVPAILGSRWVDTAEHKLPIFKLFSVIRFSALSGMAAAVLLGSYFGLSGPLIAALLLVCFAVWYAAQAVSTQAFTDIVAKSTPTTKRGSFWMWRQTGGLFLVLTVSVPLIRYMVGADSPAKFPVNYGILLGLSALVLGVSWIAYSMVHEPPSKPAQHRLTLRQHVTRGLRLWRHDPRYRRMMRVLLLLMSTGAIAPFFTAMAVKQWGMPDTVAAVFISVQIIAQMIGSQVQGRVLDRVGTRRVLITAAVAGFAMAITALLGARFAPPGGVELVGYTVPYRMLVLCACFACSGIFTAHIGPGYMSYIMDIAPQRKRPSYFGFTTVFTVPTGLVPLAYGWLAEDFGFATIFAVATILSAIALVLSQRIQEPRDELTEEQLRQFG